MGGFNLGCSQRVGWCNPVKRLQSPLQARIPFRAGSGGQGSHLLLASDPPEALLRTQQRHFHPPGQLVGLRIPATHLADHPARITHRVLNVVGAWKRHVERRRSIETIKGQDPILVTLQTLR